MTPSVARGAGSFSFKNTHKRYDKSRAPFPEDKYSFCPAPRRADGTTERKARTGIENMNKKTVRELLERLDEDRYIAIGSGNPERGRDAQRAGSGFYFIGTVKRYRKDINGINNYFRQGADDYIPLEDRIVTDIRNRNLPGEPPMLAVLAEGTETGRCWVLSEYDKSFKAPPAKINDMNGLHNLRQAIAMRAVNDYEEAVMNQKKNGITKSVGAFFRSEWGKQITGADGEKIEDVCRTRARYQMWRKKHECAKCKREKCIHRSGEHFTAMERGRIVCEKEAAEGGEE